MPALIECSLVKGAEPLQVPFPAGFKKAWKAPSRVEADEIYVLGGNQWLTPQEFDVVSTYLKTLPYGQFLSKTGAVKVDPRDRLIPMTHDQLDAIEAANQLPNTRMANGAERQTYERVLLIRESGFTG